LAAGISKASQWTGTGYTLGLNGNALKAVGLGADVAGSVALVSDPSGNVGVATSLSATPAAGARSYGGGIIIGGSTYSSLSGYRRVARALNDFELSGVGAKDRLQVADLTRQDTSVNSPDSGFLQLSSQMLA
jgi:hypothetical protein